MTTHKPNPIALAIAERLLARCEPLSNHDEYQWTVNGFDVVEMFERGDFDDLIPGPAWPVLSDETIDWLYVHCDLFDVSRPLSSAIDDGGKVPLTLVATRLRDELRAWEEWRKKMEGEK